MTGRQAVISGVGVVSAFGLGAPALFQGLREGASAVGPIRHLDAAALPVQVGGEVPLLPSLTTAPADSLPSLLAARGLPLAEEGLRAIAAADAAGALRDRKVLFCMMAALEAWRDGGCGDGEHQATLVLGLGLELGLMDDLCGLLTAGATPSLDFAGAGRGPAVRLRTPVDLPARVTRQLLGLRGPTVVNASACAAGALAVAEAAARVVRGEAEVVVAGGADSMLNPLGLGGMWRLGAPSPRATADACRPFDRRRDGLVIGEGAALFIIEEADRARRRGARCYARLLGWGSSQDAYRVTAPLPDGSAAARAMVRALGRAGLDPAAVGYINAHGTGTPLNDPAEARAIRLALGAHADRVPVSSVKGALGHLMAAAGAVELAASLLAFTDDLLPGTAHFAEPDPDCPLAVIGPTPRPARVDALLSSSFGFGGQNCCIALGRPTA